MQYFKTLLLDYYSNISLIDELVYTLLKSTVDNEYLENILKQCKARNMNINYLITDTVRMRIVPYVLENKSYSTIKVVLSYVNFNSVEPFLLSVDRNIFYYLLSSSTPLLLHKIKILVYLLRKCFVGDNNTILRQLLNQRDLFGFTPMSNFLSNTHILRLPKMITLKLFQHSNIFNQDLILRSTMLSNLYNCNAHNELTQERIFKRFRSLTEIESVYDLMVLTINERKQLASKLKIEFNQVFKNIFWASYDGYFQQYSEWLPSEVLDDVIDFVTK